MERRRVNSLLMEKRFLLTALPQTSSRCSNSTFKSEKVPKHFQSIFCRYFVGEHTWVTLALQCVLASPVEASRKGDTFLTTL